MDTQDAVVPAVQSQNSSPTLAQLEDEIKFHISQISQNIIEIGTRLIQAKSLVKHGKWSNWLESNFSLSQQTARRFMQVAERFSKTRIDTRFNSTQMIALLSLPDAEETEKFIEQKASEGTPVENMTVKTLRNEIKQWKAANKEISSSNLFFNQSQNNLVNSEPPEQSHIDFQQPYPETQSRVDETPSNYNYKEPIILKPPTEIQGTYLIEEIFSMCDSLIRHENQNEIIRSFAKNNPDQFNRGIQNLTTVISKLQSIRKKST